MFSNSKKIFCVFLAILLICITPVSVSALQNEVRTSEVLRPKLHNSAGQTVDGLKAYVDIDEFRKYLIEGFSTCPTELNISKFKIPTSAISLVASYIWYETPELFQINSFSYSYNSSGIIISLKPSYHYNSNEYSQMLNTFKKNADKLLDGIKGNSNLTDVEKALLIHDRIAVWCEYDYDRLNNGSMPQASYSAYGVLVNKFAVCMGYTLAYDYLLFQVGIDSEYCSSDLLNHAWNIVHVNNSTYHVDVTWDDPLPDKSGYVRHTNFLRSTNGIVETGHISDDSYVDYNTSPTDTTFDSYYWQNSNTAFQLIGDDIYYIDNEASALKRIHNGTIITCKTVSDTWKSSSSSYWVGNFACLSSDGEKLFYSLSTAVYEYDPEANTTKTVFTPDLSSGSYYSIYGFKLENCQFICEVYNTPQFTSTTKALNTKRMAYHKTGDWILDYGASPYEEGYKHKECTFCGAYLEDTIIPIISIEKTENSEIDYYLALLFTDSLLCNNITELVSVFNSTTVDVDNDNGFIGTGTKINISNNGEEVSYLTVIVSGDINGDGVCNVLDVNEAERFSTGAKEPTEIEIHAANGEYSTSVTPATYQALLNKALSV